jgi:hypothetical protein
MATTSEDEDEGPRALKRRSVEAEWCCAGAGAGARPGERSLA